MSTKPPASIPRRHDLDALRAVAMLLGIAIHGMISFIPGIGAGWAVHDSQASASFSYALSSIHGFRMPLFFLISGFFTMMLLRKRGMWSLLKQRFMRIFIPLMIGMFTIIPSVWMVSIYIGMQASSPSEQQQEEAAEGASAWKLAASGDVEGLRAWLDGGGDIAYREPDSGSTALHGAFLFGQDEAAEMLLAAGADPQSKDHRGQTCVAMLQTPWGITSYVGQVVGVRAIEPEVFSGRKAIAERLELPDDLGIGVPESDGRQILFGLMYFPFFHHLWFLWFLCWLVAGFAVCVTVGRMLRLPRPPRWLSASSWRYVWVIPLTLFAQSFMSGDGIGFGPDTSVGLVPMPWVLGYYAIFFGFGAMYFDAVGGQASDPSITPLKAWTGVIVSLALLYPLSLVLGPPTDTASRFLSNLIQASYAWLMTFGLMGVFQQMLARESKTMRYLSDSSYWLYLVHIPTIIVVQYWVRDYPAPAFLKFVVVCVVTSLALLASYQIFVRYTPIGTLLNGKRYKTNAKQTLEQNVSVAAP